MRAFSCSVLILISITSLLTIPCCAQTAASQGWPLLEAGLRQKASGQRLAAVRVLGLIPSDPHAAELAEKALKDTNSPVRAAAATALGQMHASGADASLKQALNDKSLSVVMAAAHALRLLNDPACYDVYYAVFTGERKNDSGMIAQEMKVLHDPKQVAEMGFNEGIGYVPFAGMGWEALQTIMKDRKGGAAAKAALISALSTDPDARTGELLLAASHNPNWVLRMAALEAIAKRGNPTLLPGIEPRLSDPKREVRYAAAATVIHLGDLARAQDDAKAAQKALSAKAVEPPATNAIVQTNK
ncbi:MAG: HEAT repeat domain-containing protein [Candidatus Sulfotelmatobacter sp.]